MSGRASVWIDADPAVLWAAIAELPRMGEWSPENVGGDWLDGGGPVVGARFRGRNRKGRGEWETVATVIDAEPGRSFAISIAEPGQVGTVWRYELEPADGGTVVTETFDWYWTPVPAEGFRARVANMDLDAAVIAVAEREQHLQRQLDTTLAALRAAFTRASE
jgi:hypothetical protein